MENVNHLLLLVRAHTLSVQLMLCPVTFVFEVPWELITFLSKWNLEFGIIHVTSHLHLIPLRNRQKLCSSSPFQHIWWESHSLSRWESCVGGIATYIYCIPIKMTLQLIFCAMILYWQIKWVDQLSTAQRPIKRQAVRREIVDFFDFYPSRYRCFDKGN